jgi:mono/diheme cytochrome c family protein
MVRPRHTTLPSVVALAAALIAAGTASQSARGNELADRVAEILETRCLRCHEGPAAEAGLSLVSPAALLTGGSSGPAVERGDPEASLLIAAISGEQPTMPAEGDPLSPNEVDAIVQWIAADLPWPDGRELTARASYDRNWWSLQPLQRPAVPQAESQWVRTPIDALIAAAHAEHGLAPAHEADRRTLIRRLSFDLIGLPPTPEEVAAFVADDDPHAYEQLVDRLLASPHYGERWGRHWLDVAHYGDTHGYDKDKLRPNAWPYRDYVIRALNEDKPYARFVEEQIAGDVLFPGTADGVIATGFLAAGPFDYVGQIEVADGTLQKAITRNLDRDDMVATVMGAFNSMTVHCARCHDHKFDPIAQADYYGLQAVFAGIDRADRPYGADENGEPAGVVYAAATEFAPEGQFTPTGGKPRTIHVLKRGSESAPGVEAAAGACGYLAELPAEFGDMPSDDEGSRRAALARWLTDPRNALTWRSIVNRVWLYHFGRGLVDTPNDFGRMGAAPSHPELLNWLAAEFRDGGQSLKSLHRLICTSAVYRQASAGNSEFDKIDAGNQYLWRMNRRRLDAECIWDATLAVSGHLDATAGGPPFRAFGFKDDHSPHYKYDEFDPADPAAHRRSVYRLIVRSVPDPFMTTLDCADSSAVVAKRNETVTPLQALAMLNNPFMLQMAERLAARVEPLGATPSEQLTAAWRLALAREPDPSEIAPLVAYAQQHGLPAACRLIFNLNEFVFID